MSDQPITLILKKSNLYGYDCHMAECPICFEEIEDEIGETKCEGCGTVYDCVISVELPKPNLRTKKVIMKDEVETWPPEGEI